MSIRIIRVKINLTQFKSWLNNEGYVCFNDEKYYPATDAHKLYDKFAKDCTFQEWCKEHEIYTRWDINHQYGSNGWEWDIIEEENSETQWLIIAVQEY